VNFTFILHSNNENIYVRIPDNANPIVLGERQEAGAERNKEQRNIRDGNI
jgi:hypothetical protein